MNSVIANHGIITAITGSRNNFRLFSWTVYVTAFAVAFWSQLHYGFRDLSTTASHDGLLATQGYNVAASEKDIVTQSIYEMLQKSQAFLNNYNYSTTENNNNNTAHPASWRLSFAEGVAGNSSLPFLTKDGPFMSDPEHFYPLNKSDEIFFDAIDVYGNRGYVADPTLFRRLVLASNLSYFDRLQYYEPHLRATNETLDSNHSCSLVPGKSLFVADGLELLKNKITVYRPLQFPHKKRIQRKLLCAMYTYDGKRELARIAALSYGWKCDGFLAFSTRTIPTLGMVGLLRRFPQGWGNMIQFSRAIWGYLAKHYLNDYDYFHLGGDDMHVIVENMRYLFEEVEPRNAKGEPLYMGLPVHRGGEVKTMNIGGPGYTLNRVALAKLAQKLPKCMPNIRAYYEDRAMAACLKMAGIEAFDTRDPLTGQHRYFHWQPDTVVQGTSKDRSMLRDDKIHWEKWHHPRYPHIKVGPLDFLDGASRYTVAFHYLRYSVWMMRHHAVLYDECPPDSPLGQILYGEKIIG